MGGKQGGQARPESAEMGRGESEGEREEEGCGAEGGKEARGRPGSAGG